MLHGATYRTTAPKTCVAFGDVHTTCGVFVVYLFALLFSQGRRCSLLPSTTLASTPLPAARLLEEFSEVCSKEGGSDLLQEDELVAEAQRATETATTRYVQGKSRQLMILRQEASVKHVFTLRRKKHPESVRLT